MRSIEVIQTYLRNEQVDGWLLYGFRDQNPIALSVAGLLSAGSRRWFLWIPAAGRPEWIVQAIERTTFLDLPEELEGKVHQYVSWQDMRKTIADVVGIKGDRQKRILMEYSPFNAIPYVSRVDAGIMELVIDATGAEIISSADAVQLVVARITPDHLEGHRRSAEVCLSIKDAAFRWISDKLNADNPITEYDAQRFIVEKFRAAGLEPLDCIVAANRNAADPHYFPGSDHKSPIRKGDVVLIDLWSREVGDPDACFADITWTAYCGTVTPAPVIEIFEIVRRARDRAVEFMQKGLAAGRKVFGYEVDDACRAVIAEAGYGDAFFHRTGHSLGSTGHFVGVNIDNLESEDRRSLLPGVMFSIEPGIYLPDFDFDGSATPKGLGIRSEINCVVHEGSVEVTTLPLQTAVKPIL